MILKTNDHIQLTLQCVGSFTAGPFEPEDPSRLVLSITIEHLPTGATEDIRVGASWFTDDQLDALRRAWWYAAERSCGQAAIQDALFE